MNTQILIVFATLFASLILFIEGRFRYDVVALVAAVLVISRGLSNAGVVDGIVRRLSLIGDRCPCNWELYLLWSHRPQRL